MPGQKIPGFNLKTPSGATINSDAFLGRRVVLAFVGGWDDAVGRRVRRRLQTALPVLNLWGASVVAVAPFVVDPSVFMPPGLPVSFPVLQDPNGVVHQAFGAVDWWGGPAPAIFLLDRSSTVIYRALAGLGESLPSTKLLISLLQFDQIAPATIMYSRRRTDGERIPQVPGPGSPRWAAPTAAITRQSLGVRPWPVDPALRVGGHTTLHRRLRQ